MVGKNCNFALTVFPEAVIVTGSKRRSKMAKASITSGELPRRCLMLLVKALTYFPKRVSSCLPVSLQSFRSSEMFVKESMSACSLSKGWLVVFKFVKVEMAQLTAGLIIEK